MRKSATQNNEAAGHYMTKAEAAEALGVSPSMVDVFDRKQLLAAHYPDGVKTGKKFLAEDVFVLAELRAEFQGDFLRRLPQIAMRAAAAARRTEKKLDEVMTFLGLNDTVLSLETEAVVTLHLRAEKMLREAGSATETEVFDWARKLVAMNEEYFELVQLHCGDPEPWRPYLDLAKALAKRASPGTKARVFLEHGRANVRNAAYFFERGARGAREANRRFPGERYAGRLIQRLLPT